MTATLDDLVRAAMTAPAERLVEAVRVLRGESLPPASEAAIPAPEPYLTLKQAAKHLHFSPATLWLWRVPGHDLGGRRRFKLSEVAAYLEGDDFKRRVAALRAERRFRLSAKGAFPKPRYHTLTKGA